MAGELSRELLELFRGGVDARLDDAEFDALARRVFRHQFAHNRIYAAFCSGRGVEPGALDGWAAIPPVPTAAFRSLPLVSAADGQVEAVFRTSGTTRGDAARGEHRVPDLELYRTSAAAGFRANLLPDDARLPLISLIPSPDRAPDSSLSYMAGIVERRFAAPGGGWFLDPDRGIREQELVEALRRLEGQERPVLILATAFALVHWLDAMEREGWHVDLPPGSRIMETGGFKGRSRTVSRSALYRRLGERMGVEPGWIVNEYGMTELLSQLYESVLRDRVRYGADAAVEDPDARALVPPPWLRVRVLDPSTLAPAAPGEPGLLCHFDLANLGSVSAVLTEDLGVSVSGGIRVLGRAADAQPRGCSLAMDELLGAADGRR